MSAIQAARVAASLKKDPGVDVEIVDGRYGEFAVLVDGDKLISAGPLGFVGVLPSVRKVHDLVESRLLHT